MYLIACTRLDLAFTLSLLNRYMSSPDPKHWKALKWLLRYLNDTFDEWLVYNSILEGVKFKDFKHVDDFGDRDNIKLPSSYVFILCGSCVS